MILGQRRGIFKWNKFQFDDIEDTRKKWSVKTNWNCQPKFESQTCHMSTTTTTMNMRWREREFFKLNKFFSLSREKCCKTNLGSGCVSFLEGLLRTPEVWGSNPVIGKHFKWTFVYCQLYWIDENKEKVAGNGPFLKNTVKPIYLCSNYLSVF